MAPRWHPTTSQEGNLEQFHATDSFFNPERDGAVLDNHNNLEHKDHQSIRPLDDLKWIIALGSCCNLTSHERESSWKHVCQTICLPDQLNLTLKEVDQARKIIMCDIWETQTRVKVLWNTKQGQSFCEIQSRVKVFGNKIQRLSPLRGWVGQMANSTAEVTWHQSDYDILYVYCINIHIYVVGSTLLKLSHLYMSFQSLCSSNSFCSFSQASSTKLWKAQVMVTMVMMMTISILAKMALPMAIL